MIRLGLCLFLYMAFCNSVDGKDLPDRVVVLNGARDMTLADLKVRFDQKVLNAGKRVLDYPFDFVNLNTPVYFGRYHPDLKFLDEFSKHNAPLVAGKARKGRYVYPGNTFWWRRFVPRTTILSEAGEMGKRTALERAKSGYKGQFFTWSERILSGELGRPVYKHFYVESAGDPNASLDVHEGDVPKSSQQDDNEGEDPSEEMVNLPGFSFATLPLDGSPVEKSNVQTFLPTTENSWEDDKEVVKKIKSILRAKSKTVLNQLTLKSAVYIVGHSDMESFFSTDDSIKINTDVLVGFIAGKWDQDDSVNQKLVVTSSSPQNDRLKISILACHAGEEKTRKPGVKSLAGQVSQKLAALGIRATVTGRMGIVISGDRERPPRDPKKVDVQVARVTGIPMRAHLTGMKTTYYTDPLDLEKKTTWKQIEYENDPKVNLYEVENEVEAKRVVKLPEIAAGSLILYKNPTPTPPTPPQTESSNAYFVMTAPGDRAVPVSATNRDVLFGSLLSIVTRESPSENNK